MKELIEGMYRAGIIYGVLGTLIIEAIIGLIWYIIREKRKK